MPDPRGSRRAPGGYRTSILGRVDWACWLAALGFLILTVVAFAVQFAPLGIIAAILAVGLVAFDSWVNRPKGPRAARRSAGRADTGWRSGVRGQQTPPPPRAPAQNFRGGGFRPNPQQPPPRRQPPQGQPQRRQMGQQPPRQQPPRQQGQLPGQPQRGVQQGQPPRPPFRPAPPGSSGGDQDFRARR